MLSPPKAALAVLGLLVAVLVSAASAQTYSTSQITVNGQNYVLSFQDGSFEQVNNSFGGGFLEGQPWWNSPTPDDPDTGIDTFRSAFDAAWNSFFSEGLLAAETDYNFAGAFNTASTVVVSKIRVGSSLTTNSADRSFGGGTTNVTSENITTSATYNQVYIAAQAVPEIDGNVLAQMGLILGTALLWLRTRKKRQIACIGNEGGPDGRHPAGMA